MVIIIFYDSTHDDENEMRIIKVWQLHLEQHHPDLLIPIRAPKVLITAITPRPTPPLLYSQPDFFTTSFYIIGLIVTLTTLMLILFADGNRTSGLSKSPVFTSSQNQPDQPKSWTMDRHYIPLHTMQGQRWVGIVNWADTNPWNWAFRGSWGEHLYLKVLNKPTLNIIKYLNLPHPQPRGRV